MERILVKARVSGRVSDTAWGNVDKSQLGQRAAQMYADGTLSKANAREIWAWVPDEAFGTDSDGKPKFTYSKAKLPHHELTSEGEIVLNRGGVHGAASAVAGARSKPDIPAGDLPAVKRHLRKHYRTLEEDIPDALKMSFSETVPITLTRRVAGVYTTKKTLSVEETFTRAYDAISEALARMVIGKWDPTEGDPPTFMDVEIFDVFSNKAIAYVAATNEFMIVPFKVEGDNVIVLTDQIDNLGQSLFWTAMFPDEMNTIGVRRANVLNRKIGDKWFYVAVISGAFEDRTREIVTLEGLENAVKRLDQSATSGGDYGPLWLGHLPGSEVGRSIGTAVVDKLLLDVGYYHDTPEGRKAKVWVDNHPNDASVSIGFKPHKSDYDGGYKVYRDIEIVERSIAPKNLVACWWTFIQSVSDGGTSKMDIETMRRFLGDVLGDQGAADDIISRAGEQSEAMTRAGIVTRTAEDEENVPDGETAASETVVEAEEEKLDEPVVEELPAEEPASEEVIETKTEMEDEEEQGQVLYLAPDAVDAIAAKVTGDMSASLTEALSPLAELGKKLDEIVAALDEVRSGLQTVNQTEEERIEERLAKLPQATLRAAVRAPRRTEQKVGLPDVGELTEKMQDRPVSQQELLSGSLQDSIDRVRAAQRR